MFYLSSPQAVKFLESSLLNVMIVYAMLVGHTLLTPLCILKNNPLWLLFHYLTELHFSLLCFKKKQYNNSELQKCHTFKSTSEKPVRVFFFFFFGPPLVGCVTKISALQTCAVDFLYKSEHIIRLKHF